MEHNLTTVSNQRERRAAILIASIDPKLGMTLLSSLAPEEAERVRRQLQDLGEIDSQERAAVLEAFRNGEVAAPVAVAHPALVHDDGGVELDFSRSIEKLEQPAEPTDDGSRRSSSALDSADVDVVAEFLNREHAQTVAVVLSRMSDDRAATVFAALQDEMKPDVLARLSKLEPADEQVVLDLESHLFRWVEEHRQRQQRAQAGVEMVNRILAKTPETDRAALLLRMSQGESPAVDGPAESVDTTGRRTDGSVAAQRVAASVTDQRRGMRVPVGDSRPVFTQVFAADTAKTLLPTSDPSRPAAGAASDAEEPNDLLADRSALLEQFDDAALMRSLAGVDEMTARLALAGSSEAVLQRVLKKLSWRRGRRLRKQLRCLPPLPVAELRLAQQAVIREACGSDSAGDTARSAA